ncbi:hypothetical protein D3C71_1583480 [compost metagenome]
MHHRPAGRQRVGRRARGRGDDQAVGALVGDEVAADFHAQLDHARSAAAVDHDIVHGQGFEHQLIAAHHARADHRPQVFLVFPLQHGREGGLVIFERNVRDEAQAAMVDADQRRAVARQMAADAQHGAVAADDQAQVAIRAQAVDVHGAIALDAGIRRRIGIDNDFAPLLGDKAGDILEGLAHTVRAGAGGGWRLVFPYQCDSAELRRHFEITSLKSFHAR